jgi:hypothetical protein
MPVSRIIRATNWKYAVGEVFLIVVGITLALMATSWYENWQERRYESLVLEQLRVALESDLELFDDYFRTLKQSERDLAALLKHLRSGDPYSPKIGAYFNAVILWRGDVRMRTAPYEELKNRGFSLISNPSLRTKLIDLYEDKFPTLRGTSLIDRAFSTTQVSPYFNARFRSAENGDRLPIDYSALRSDPLFENLALEKHRRLRERLLPKYDRLTAGIRDVLAEIEAELD